MKSTHNVADRPVFLSVRDTAWVLGVQPSVVHRAIRVGTLRTVRRRSRLVVAQSDLERWAMPGGAT